MRFNSLQINAESDIGLAVTKATWNTYNFLCLTHPSKPPIPFYIDMLTKRLKAYELKHRRMRRVRRIHRNYDEEAAAVMEKVLDYTMIPNESLFALIEAVRYVNQWKIPGSFVECGVWRGGATMCAVLSMMQLAEFDRSSLSIRHIQRND